MAAKQTLYHNQILSGAQFNCANSEVNAAFYSAKANVLMSTMDLRPYYVAPFMAAGFPVYTMLFGGDSSMSIPGVTAAGFSQPALDALNCITYYTQQKNGHAPHEVAANGLELGWDHVQVTPSTSSLPGGISNGPPIRII